jgi:uncharacterized membrane protein
MASIRPETFLEIGHTMIANLGGPMSVLMPAALLSSLMLLIVLFRQRRAAAFNLALVSLVLMALALVVTLAVNVPIDGEISGWTVNTLPSDWTTIRDRWELYHSIRTFVSLGALGFAIASALRWTPSLAREAR